MNEFEKYQIDKKYLEGIGQQTIFKFGNEVGVSVIELAEEDSEDTFEIAVLKFDDQDRRIPYPENGITDISSAKRVQDKKELNSVLKQVQVL